MQVKLRDIATELNLSVSTISRVVNGKDRVAPGTRDKVLAALNHADYRPNEAARSLRMRTATTIIIVVPDIANNYYASLIKGAQSVCRANGYSLMVYNTDENPQLERELLCDLAGRQIAGMILASVVSTAAQVRALRQSGLPVVYVDNIPPATESYNSVAINNMGAAYALTNKMFARGYRRIGFITGTLTQSSGSERLQGYRAALRDAGLAEEETLIAQGDFKAASGYAGMCALLERRADMQAVIVSNNFMTFGAVRAIREAGLRIPQDMAIAGFDVVDESALIAPQITSINQPATEIGERAADILFASLSEGVYTNLLLDPVFLPGNSW